MFTKEMLQNMGVQEVIFNDKVTVVKLFDGNRGVAKCSENDYNDPMVGFSVAYALAKSGTESKKEFKNNINYIINKKKGKFKVNEFSIEKGTRKSTL